MHVLVTKLWPTAAPEIYCRPSGEVYACRGGPELSLPRSTAEVQVDDTACQALFTQVGAISPTLANGTITARQVSPSVASSTPPIHCVFVRSHMHHRHVISPAYHTPPTHLSAHSLNSPASLSVLGILVGASATRRVPAVPWQPGCWMATWGGGAGWRGCANLYLDLPAPGGDDVRAGCCLLIL